MYKILVADDVQINRRLIKSLLSRKIKDLVFYEAVDGSEVIECLKNNRIDLVVLDIMMPKMNGFEVLSQIKESKRLRDIPVIVNSALDDIENIKKALELGAYDYFAKPLTFDQIETIIPIKVENAITSYEHKKQLMRINNRINEEIRIAGIFQHTLMEDYKLLNLGEVCGKYIPSVGISGDFYDSVEINNSLWFIIADVSGHGVAAAMISSMIKVAFNNSVYKYNNPNEVLMHINKIFYNMSKENYEIIFTAFIGKIEGRKLIYSNGGHPYPILYDRLEKGLFMIEENGFPIGILPKVEYSVKSIYINKGTYIFVYTDGIFNLISDKKNSNWNDLFKLCKDNLNFIVEMFHENSKSFMESVLNELLNIGEKSLKDDVALMVIRVI